MAAWLGADNYGNLVAYLHTADRLNRIYCYLFRPFCDSTVAEEFTLDELLAYAAPARSANRSACPSLPNVGAYGRYDRHVIMRNAP